MLDGAAGSAIVHRLVVVGDLRQPRDWALQPLAPRRRMGGEAIHGFSDPSGYGGRLFATLTCDPFFSYRQDALDLLKPDRTAKQAHDKSNNGLMHIHRSRTETIVEMVVQETD